MKDITILGIDTSCDDTAVAVTRNKRVLSNIVSSQIDVHKEWGGVVPRLARRAHEEMIDGCVKLALKRAGLKSITEVDAIAVTYGPGLAPALEVGVRKAKELALEHSIKLIAVDHMEGHTLSTLLQNKKGKSYAGLEALEFPAMALCVSGGHTEIVWIEKLGKYKLIGQTLDDAAGEAFDKVARMLDLGYPGGAVLSKLAEDGDPTTYDLPRPMHKSPDYNYSFSGLKTACLYSTNNLKERLGSKKFAKIIPDYCASFQEAVVDSLLAKCKRAAKKMHPKMLLLGGGVAANKRLRSKVRTMCRKLDVPVYFPDKKFTSDNAAMIGLVGYFKYQRKEFVKNVEALDRDPSITIDDILY